MTANSKPDNFIYLFICSLFSDEFERIRKKERSWPNFEVLSQHCESGSSGSIVSDYGLDDREIEVRSLAERKDFSSSLSVKTGSGAHPASCTMGTGGPFPGAKARPGLDADHSPPSSAEVESEYEVYILSPQALPLRVVWQLFIIER
jgi:hypothetical protein